MSYAIGVFDGRGGRLRLLVDKKTLEGKYATPCGDVLYGPFDTIEEALAFEPKPD